MTELGEIFKSYDIRGEVGTTLTNETVENIARAYANPEGTAACLQRKFCGHLPY